MTLELQITATDKITMMDGVPVRVWDGVTADGIACKVFVHRIAVSKEDDTDEFDNELEEQMPPGRHVPLSMIL